MSGPATFSEQDGLLRFSGTMTLSRLGDLPQRLADMSARPQKIDISDVDRMDTVGAWLVHRIARECDVEIEGAGEEEQRLIDQVSQVDKPLQVHAAPEYPLLRVLREVGDATVAAGRTLYGLIDFLGASIIASWQIILNPGRLRGNAVVRQFETVGVQALGIVGLMSFLIGIVIAQQGAIQLRQFGAEVYTINLVGRLDFRELGVLMTAIMVAGRSGSAFAAQIGSMRLAEEVDAMRTIGISPMEALVLPRIAAAIVMMPLLAFYAALLGMIGGGLFCWTSLDIPPVSFVERIREVVPLTDVLQGLIKAPVFGAIIAVAGCFQGMQVEGNAEQVGLRTTAAVVQSIFMVIVLDAFFAVFFASIGWI